ncbi:FG-GAP repeat protein [Planctomycetes bacterium Poly30]|uniref:FG-GAP repeat protein n=1 Tax=Saltatorellus ferox TaxID=2528018 RepID=A0A518EV84_9BACT|nr:FG-GAP repeat protein [Planctomycetes bacterium Poly30]
MSIVCLPLLLASVQFAPLKTISTPVRDLTGTVAGDFDGDGDLDLIVLDRANQGSVLLEATSPGAFAPAMRLDLGDAVIEGAISGELTGDGLLDLVVVPRMGTDGMLLLEGRGDGTFEPPRSLGAFRAFNGAPRLVDLNQDGRLDILASGRGLFGGELTLYQNLGAGAFAPPRELVQGSSSDAQALDLDADGDLDLLTAWPGAGLLVFLNDGTGQFQLGSVLTPDASVDQVELLDLDGDGDLDAIASKRYQSVVFTFENVGGAFGPRQEYLPGTSSTARLSIVDVDRDGQRDVVVFSAAAEAPVWLRNEPGFVLGSARALATAERGRVATMEAADLNGDGIADFVLSTRQDVVKLLMSDASLGAIPYGDEASVLLAQVPAMEDVAWVDLDSDGDLDLVGASDSGELYVSEGRGFVRWDLPLSLGITAGPHLETADLDGDGDVDLVSVDDMGRAVLLENTGLGTLTPRMLTSGAVSLAPRIELADMNGDGLLDLVGIGDTLGIVVVSQSGVGGGVFLPPVFVATLSRPVIRTMVTDVDQNGVPDISAVAQTPSGMIPPPRHLIWLEGLGAGSFAAPSPLIDGLVAAARPIPFSLDGQGFIDFVWTSTAERAGFSAVSSAPGVYAVADVGIDPGGLDARFGIGDLRGAGFGDLVVSGGPANGAAGQTLRLYWRNGLFFDLFQGVLAERLIDVRSIRFADLDGDGDEDILLAAGGPQLSWIENLRVGPLGTLYCGPAALNSAGSAGTISAVGSEWISLGDVTLRSSDLPTGSTGIFLTSQAQGFVPIVPGSVGSLCLGGAIGRFQGPGQVQSVSADGVIQLELDLSSLPQPTGGVPALPGTLWFFQAWYRDTSGGQPVSNFTDGLALVFR